MPWTPGPGHGFTLSDVEPWLPFGDGAEHRNVETQLAEATSILALYRRLLRLRRARSSLRIGSLAYLRDTPEDVLGFTRTNGDERTLVLINFTDETKLVDVGHHATLLLSTNSAAVAIESGTAALGPNEAVVIDPGSDA